MNMPGTHPFNSRGVGEDFLNKRKNKYNKEMNMPGTHPFNSRGGGEKKKDNKKRRQQKKGGKE